MALSPNGKTLITINTSKDSIETWEIHKLPSKSLELTEIESIDLPGKPLL